MGGTIGVGVLGAILANRVASEMTKGLSAAGIAVPGGGGSGEGSVPDMSTLPGPMRTIVEHAYAVATADLFLIATPFAVLALVAVVFIKEKPLKTTSGMERLAEESGEGPTAPAGKDPAPVA
jgi:hypothetical protein